MNARLTLSTALRVLEQIRNDRRTIAILLVIPCLLMGIVAWMFEGTPVIDRFGPLLLGIFPLFIMFLVTSVATLRERQSGTLERLMTTPIRRGDFVLGYAIAFAALATLQALVLTGFAVWVLGMDILGQLWLVIVVAVLDAVLGTALGLAASSLATTEFQAVQMMPVVILPQLLTGGLLMPRDDMPMVLEWISRAMPLTYGMESQQQLAAGAGFADVQGQIGAIVAFIVGALVLGTLTLHRRTP
jgi:ABC-2 type transport system permease protein